MAQRTNRARRGVVDQPAERRKVADSYLELVKRFPLVPIRDDRHLDDAVEVIDALLARDLDEAEQQYFDVLTRLVEDYEEEQVPISEASEADVLRELMRANGLSQSALGRASGIAQSTISAVLNGSRRLTREQISRLSELFGVGPSAFM